MSPTQTPVAPENRAWQGRRERGVQRTRATEDAARRRSGERPGGGLTLGQKLDRVWEGLHAAGAAECPVCQARMTAEAVPVCFGCGSRLS